MKRSQASLSLLLLIGLIYYSFYSLMPREGTPATLPETEFSTERALIPLKEITKAPHYIGTEENIRVREYLIEQLQFNFEKSIYNDLEKKENEVTEDLEFFILNELLDDDKIKIYKKYLNKKLNNISKLEILGQKDDIINKIISTDFSQKEKLGLINLLENKIKQKAEEDFENSIQEKLKSIEENALKLKENISTNVNKNKIVKSL